MAVVGEPLNPSVLDRIRALTDWPPAPERVSPDGNWVHTYRIWTCHGFTDRGNSNPGVIRIERVAGAAEQFFTLNVRQRVVHVGDIVHELRARIECRNDRLASPQKWSLTSRFFESNGKEREGLVVQEQGRCRDERVVRTINGRAREMTVSAQTTADWCLFEALQRWPLRRGESPAFDVLEGLSVHRPGHRITYRGQETIERSGKPLKLHRFSQLGQGMLPYDYWLDDARRLVLAATLSRVYILDPQAENKVRWRRRSRARKEK